MLFSNSLTSVTAVSTVSTVFWWSLYKKFRRTNKWEQEFTARFVAVIHASIVVVLAYISIKYGPDPLVSPGEPNTDFQVITMYVSIGYFIYDFFWCLKHQPEPKIMLFHHLASIVALAYILYYGNSGSEAVGGLGSLELTNPLLQARWFLRTLGYSRTVMYTIVEVAFFVLFLVIRLGYGSWLLISVLGSEKSPFPVKVCTVMLYLITLAFIYSIARFIVKRMLRKDGEEDDDGDDDDVKLS